MAPAFGNHRGSWDRFGETGFLDSSYISYLFVAVCFAFGLGRSMGLQAHTLLDRVLCRLYRGFSLFIDFPPVP